MKHVKLLSAGLICLALFSTTVSSRVQAAGGKPFSGRSAGRLGGNGNSSFSGNQGGHSGSGRQFSNQLRGHNATINRHHGSGNSGSGNHKINHTPIFNKPNVGLPINSGRPQIIHNGQNGGHQNGGHHNGGHNNGGHNNGGHNNGGHHNGGHHNGGHHNGGHNNGGHHNGGHKVHHQIFQKFGNHCTLDSWCHTAHQKCHWWYNYCPQIQLCSPACVQIQYVYIPCTVNGVIVQNFRWYMGMSGMFLPGRGIGVETVEPGSPAEQIGLLPGNVITSANGVLLQSPEDFDRIVAESGGILTLDVVVEDGAVPQQVQLALQQVAVERF
jgi:hypothetical protein